MEILFIGGPWHGETRQGPNPLPSRIDAPDHTTYIPWKSHPATAGVLAEPLETMDAYVVEALEVRELLKRVEDFLLHMSNDRAA